MQVEYQFHDDAAVPDLGRLWAEHTEWGKETFPGVQAWLAASPFGKPHAVTAVDGGSGAIVGQCYFYPTVVSVDGRPVRAARPFGVIASPALTRSVRTIEIADQPMVAMFRHGARALALRGTQLIHMTPDPRWLGFLRRSPEMQVARFPLWSRPLPDDALPALPPGYTAAPLAAWDAQVDRLWEATARRYGCAAVRDVAALRWKLARGSYAATGVTRGGALVGLATSVRHPHRQWLLHDLLTADDEDALRATLAAVVALGDAAARETAGRERKFQIAKVSLLATPRIQPVLGTLGFAPDAYHFPLAVLRLTPTISPEAVAPERWYLAADD